MDEIEWSLLVRCLCDMLKRQMHDRARSRLCNGLLNGNTHMNHVEGYPRKDQDQISEIHIPGSWDG